MQHGEEMVKAWIEIDWTNSVPAENWFNWLEIAVLSHSILPLVDDLEVYELYSSRS